MVGAKVDLSQFNPMDSANHAMIGLALVLIMIAIISKVVCGWIPWQKGLNRWVIGIGMIPRGEVGLIFAQIGLSSGVIGMPLYTALIGMVVVTTFVTPPLLKRVFR